MNFVSEAWRYRKCLMKVVHIYDATNASPFIETIGHFKIRIHQGLALWFNESTRLLIDLVFIQFDSGKTFDWKKHTFRLEIRLLILRSQEPIFKVKNR